MKVITTSEEYQRFKVDTPKLLPQRKYAINPRGCLPGQWCFVRTTSSGPHNKYISLFRYTNSQIYCGRVSAKNSCTLLIPRRLAVNVQIKDGFYGDTTFDYDLAMMLVNLYQPELTHTLRKEIDPLEWAECLHLNSSSRSRRFSLRFTLGRNLDSLCHSWVGFIAEGSFASVPVNCSL